MVVGGGEKGGKEGKGKETAGQPPWSPPPLWPELLITTLLCVPLAHATLPYSRSRGKMGRTTVRTVISLACLLPTPPQLVSKNLSYVSYSSLGGE